MISRAEFNAQVTWMRHATPDQLEMRRLRVMRRSWLRGARGASNPEEFRAAARLIRRWMRRVRRRLNAEKRRRP